MRLKMLIGMSGTDFVLDPGEVTERFEDKEAKRLIASGFAEKAPPIVKPKPATKQEWDDERDALIAENERLSSEVLAAEEREAALISRLEKQDALINALREGLAGLGLDEPQQDPSSITPSAEPVGGADVVRS